MIAAPPLDPDKRRSPLAAGSAQYENNSNEIVAQCAALPQAETPDHYAGRCVACLTPTAKPHHRYCRACWAWGIAGQHLGRYVALTRLVREVAR
jgi:hypothetical protein